MRSSTIALLVSALGLVAAQDLPKAKPATGNPDVNLVAKLPQGTVTAKTGPNGVGVQYHIALTTLPTQGTPFMYHVHEKAVPADGNCTGTGAHLDPTKRGEVPACDATKPDTCQIGDLSGKFGNVTTASTAFHKIVVDRFASLKPGDPAYIGDKSVVFHLTDKKRVGCANFTKA